MQWTRANTNFLKAESMRVVKETLLQPVGWIEGHEVELNTLSPAMKALAGPPFAYRSFLRIEIEGREAYASTDMQAELRDSLGPAAEALARRDLQDVMLEFIRAELFEQ